MKKAIFLFTILFTTCISDAQNWQCLQAGVKHYFINSSNYLRGIRIDSTRTLGDTVVYYPFHTTRGNYSGTWTTPLDTNGGSWLGKSVLQLNDGLFLFDNIWHDTVFIKTQAHVGDTWMFYNDTTPHYYKAKLLSEDTMTVLGILDSIKTIRINAYNATVADTTNLMNNFQIVLSKNNGFVSVFDLYTFPYHNQDTAFYTGVDYYMDFLFGVVEFTTAYSPTATNIQFTLVPLINPTYAELYDWNIGDVFENSIFNWSVESDGTWPYGYYFDSIISKTILSSGVQYGFTGWMATQHFPEPWPIYYYPLNYPYDTFSTTGILTFPNQLLIDTTFMPEEKNTHFLQHYFPYDTSYCLRSPSYNFTQSNISGTTFQVDEEGSGPTITHKTGLGLLNYDMNILGGSPPLIDDTTLLYYVKAGDICGHYTVPSPIYSNLSVPVLSGAVIDIYPNPATSSFTITSSEKINNISITNLLGQMVYSHQYSSEKVEVDVSGLPSGVYFIKINGSDSYRGEVRRFVKE